MHSPIGPSGADVSGSRPWRISADVVGRRHPLCRHSFSSCTFSTPYPAAREGRAAARHSGRDQPCQFAIFAARAGNRRQQRRSGAACAHSNIRRNLTVRRRIRRDRDAAAREGPRPEQLQPSDAVRRRLGASSFRAPCCQPAARAREARAPGAFMRKLPPARRRRVSSTRRCLISSSPRRPRWTPSCSPTRKRRRASPTR